MDGAGDVEPAAPLLNPMNEDQDEQQPLPEAQELLPGARVVEIQVDLQNGRHRIVRPVYGPLGPNNLNNQPRPVPRGGAQPPPLVPQLQPQGQPPPIWANMINQPRYAQNHVFRALFFRAARTYISYFPEGIRRGLEFALLVQALLFLTMLTYIHVNYSHLSLPCLGNKTFITEENYREFSRQVLQFDELPKFGIIRVEVVEELARENYTLMDSYLKEFRPADVVETWIDSSHHEPKVTHATNDTDNSTDGILTGDNDSLLYSSSEFNETISSSESWLHTMMDSIKPDVSLFSNHHVVEFAEDYGLLRLSPKARRALNVSVLLAVIVTNDTCVGSWLDRCILSELLGLDEIVIASIRYILPNSTRRGFVRNVITGETYRFVPASIFTSGTLPPVFSLIIAAIVMLLFTVLVALLLRYSHHQIYACVVDALSSFEQPIHPGMQHRGQAGFRLIIPIVPLLVIVLAMVGLETVMAEFFQDSPTAFYVIVTIWLADQYFALCCHSPASRKWWPRFFFVYHWLFYAYYVKFSGQFGQLALAASWLFIQHSMVWFIHHHQLPDVEQARE